MTEEYPYPIIAKEGWTLIFVSLAVVSVLTAFLGLNLFTTLLWIAFIIVLQFFRDPPRRVPSMADAVLSPADGTVLKIEPAKDPVTKEQALKISVFMNLFNVHSQRSPVDGVVETVKYTKGSFLSANLDKASEKNERNAVTVRMENGERVTFVQVAGLVTHRILCDLKKGDVVQRGDRYGFIRFGSRLDVYVPPESQPLVVIGEKVLATETVLAKLPD